MKYVRSCLSATEDRENSFHRCGVRARLVRACLCVGNPDKAVLTSEDVVWSTFRPVSVPGKIEKADFTDVEAV